MEPNWLKLLDWQPSPRSFSVLPEGVRPGPDLVEEAAKAFDALSDGVEAWLVSLPAREVDALERLLNEQVWRESGPHPSCRRACQALALVGRGWYAGEVLDSRDEAGNP